MDPCSKTRAARYWISDEIRGSKELRTSNWPIRSRDSKFKCLWNSLTRSSFTGVCRFFLSQLPHQPHCQERRVGEDPENEFLAAPGSPRMAFMCKIVIKRFRIAFTANVKLNHVTKFSLYLSFTVYYLYTEISCFMLCSSSRLILDNFFLLISNLKSYQLASHVCSLPWTRL